MKKITLLLIFLTASLSGFAQNTYYTENFESGDLNGWVTNDLDGDTNEWAVLDASPLDTNFGTGSLVSFSYTGALGALTPDNLVTSPAIDLSNSAAETNLYLFYDQLTNTSYPNEKYSVYITTSDDPAVITAATPLYTTTVSNGAFTNKFLNITPYIGQTIYISFRHYDCTDAYYLVVDNIKIKSLVANDAQLVSAKLNRYSLTSTDNTLTLTVKNTGSNPITNLTVNWNDGTDHISTINKAIAVGATSTSVIHPTKVNYTGVVEKNLALTITAVNGNTDPVPANNTGTKKFNTVSQASPKKVLFEEGTGTWCGWCPRGMVGMAYMDTTYPTEFVGVAVHNYNGKDIMQLDEYNAGANYSGFPSMNVDRIVKDVDASQAVMVSNYNTRKLLTTPVSLDATGNVNGADVTINASATFRTNFANANYRLGVIISEDNVTGTDDSYSQTNYYSGGANGAMGGYEALANPVPAADMVYNHVGRALLGGYDGQDGSVPGTITDGLTANYTFNYTVPSTSNVDNMHAVLVLIDQDNGEVVNTKSISLSTLAVNQNQLTPTVALYPNPATSFFAINNLKTGNYTITVYDLAGKAVQTLSNKEVIDNQPLMISTKGISTGEYVVTIASGNASYSKHLLVK